MSLLFASVLMSSPQGVLAVRAQATNEITPQAFLPLVQVAEIRPRIHGRALYGGQGVAGVPVTLNVFDAGSNYIRSGGSGVTESDGRYMFLNVSPLQQGEIYYVQFQGQLSQSTPQPAFNSWTARPVRSYQPGDIVDLGSSELSETISRVPCQPELRFDERPMVALPVSIEWGDPVSTRRPVTITIWESREPPLLSRFPVILRSIPAGSTSFGVTSDLLVASGWNLADLGSTFVIGWNMLIEDESGGHGYTRVCQFRVLR